jgi:hypothetical protein
LQTALTGHFLAQEQAKGHQGDWNRLRLVSSAQETVLARFVAAVEASGRWDLARCLLQAGSTLLSADLPLSFWTGSLQGNGPQRLAERLEVRRSALGLLRQWLVLRQWAERARGIGYFEDGYAAAQFWLSDWERARGDDVARRVQDVLRRAEPLRPGNQAGANEDEP